MAKSSAAKKTKISVIDWFNSGSGNCPSCGHRALDHVHNAHAPGGESVECPALPPSKQVTVDEAVATKTDFERELAAAQGADAQAERKKLALVNFEKKPGESHLLDVKISQLHPYKGNPRGEDVGDTSGLEKVMDVIGFLGTLSVRARPEDLDTFEVIIGNRRLQAAKNIGLKVVPCEVFELDDVQALEMNVALLQRCQRLAVGLLRDACRLLMEKAGYDEHQVAEKFGKSASWVTKRVALCSIAPELRKAFTKGSLAVTLANALASLPTHQQQLKAYDTLEERGNDLGSSSRYLDATEKAPKDKQGRTWGELASDVTADERPQLHLAQDNGGKLRQLYVGDKLLEACATHLKLRWAKNVVEEAQERAPTPEKKAKQEAEQAEKRLIRQVRDSVFDSTLDQVAAKMAANFAPLPQLRFLAARLGERALERFTAALGKKKLPKDWVEKGATPAELLALVWLDDAVDELRSYDEYDERFLAIAKTHGIDVKAAFDAQLATAKTEAIKGGA